MVFGATGLFLLLAVICGSYGQSADSQEVEKLVRQWAPLVWMSPTERYLPLSVEEFLDNVYVADKNGNIEYSSWGPSKKNSKLSYLVTYRSLDHLRNDSLSFLHGRNPNLYPVPIYAVVTRCPARKSHHDDKKTPRGNNINAIYDMENLFYFHVSYWIFYPYNEGKDICFLGRVPTPRLFNTCLGKPKTMGNHVGDWEHMSLLFNGKRVPEKMYLAVHNTGVYYNYDQKGRYFKFEGQTTGKYNRIPKFPEIVRTQGDHPVVFAAHGSHGLWASPGEHDYHRVPRLTDKNGYGIPWKTWNNIKIYNLGQNILPSWMAFKGKWGNPKSNCLFFQKLGICEHVDGPHGILRNKQDFYCW